MNKDENTKDVHDTGTHLKHPAAKACGVFQVDIMKPMGQFYSSIWSAIERSR